MKKILVVEDEDIIAMNLEEHLTEMGYEVVGIATSGVGAIEKARELRPDLILMDIAMPGEKDGIEASEDIRSEMDVPIIFLTAYADEELIKRAKMIEPSGYIVKPYEDRELRAAIEVALHKKYKEKLYKQQQKVKEINIMAKLREQAEKIKDLEARNVDIKIDMKLLFEYIDLIILGLLADKPMTGGDILEEIHRRFGIRVNSEALGRPLDELEGKKVIESFFSKERKTLVFKIEKGIEGLFMGPTFTREMLTRFLKLVKTGRKS